MRGAGNGRFVHGEALKKYPRGWNGNHKRKIRERDGDCCRLCGREKEGQINLHVHHINYVKADIDPTNLITLCKYCHGQMHGGVVQRAMWQRRLSALLNALG